MEAKAAQCEIAAPSGDDLDKELARRLILLRDITPDEDCAAGSRPILLAALWWTLTGFTVWVAGVVILT
jgi:hypothetical protein